MAPAVAAGPGLEPAARGSGADARSGRQVEPLHRAALLGGGGAVGWGGGHGGEKPLPAIRIGPQSPPQTLSGVRTCQQRQRHPPPPQIKVPLPKPPPQHCWVGGGGWGQPCEWPGVAGAGLGPPGWAMLAGGLRAAGGGVRALTGGGRGHRVLGGGSDVPRIRACHYPEVPTGQVEDGKFWGT